jgi:hypothetical protein
MIGKLAAAEFAKQLLHMPGVIHSSGRRISDGESRMMIFILNISTYSIVPAFLGLAAPRCGWPNDFTPFLRSASALIYCWHNSFVNSSHALS